MSSDELTAGLLIVSFAAWTTVHVVLSAKLLFTSPHWYGPIALLVPPLAPYWGARSGRHVLAFSWVLLLLVWLVVRIVFSK